jgi:hypothetical protein
MTRLDECGATANGPVRSCTAAEKAQVEEQLQKDETLEAAYCALVVKLLLHVLFRPVLNCARIWGVLAVVVTNMETTPHLPIHSRALDSRAVVVRPLSPHRTVNPSGD